ncbi:MAG: hypothetical protein E3J70_05375 [Candidatus Heimdallarchaeota archaeon]|nr:MAG: hypothetical protein E3J70_05375 [Candidatus Heimdallarchaeota archaeon]
MDELAEIVGKIVLCVVAVIGMVVVLAGIGLLLAFPIKWTWNVTMPYLFSLPTITWGKAWCLNFLCGCLIKASQGNMNKKL